MDARVKPAHDTVIVGRNFRPLDARRYAAGCLILPMSSIFITTFS